MPRVARIRRTIPSASAIKPVEPIPVIVTMVWHDGTRENVPAVALAWTRAEVEIRWTTPWGDESVDWVTAAQVRRPNLGELDQTAAT